MGRQKHPLAPTEAQFAMGTMPFLIILALLAFCLFALVNGLGASELLTYVSITAVLVGGVGLLWWRIAFKSPQWRMGTQASMVLVVLAFISFFIIAPKIEGMIPSSLRFQLVPLLALTGQTSQVTGMSLSIIGIAGLLFVGVIVAFFKRPQRKW